MKKLLSIFALSAACLAQSPDVLTWQDKLRFHADKAFGPTAIAGIAAYAAFLQDVNSPREWGQGGGCLRRAVRLRIRRLGDPRCAGVRSGFDAAPGPALLSLPPLGLPAPRRTCAARNPSHAHRRRRRDCVHLANRQRLRHSLSLQFVVSGPARYGPPGIHAGLHPARVRSGE